MSRFERWSRRKRGLDDAIENAAETPLASVSPTMPAHADVPPYENGQAADDITADIVTEQDDELRSEQGDPDALLADPDTLDPSSDFKAYLAPGVSPELKRRALRRMFTASQYNVRDGLDDYDQDFTLMRDLSPEIASKLRSWMNQLAEDTATADDNDATSLASQTHDEQRDTTTDDSLEARGEDPPSDTVATSDPSRPTNGTV